MGYGWRCAGSGKEMRAKWSPELEHKLKELGIKPRIVWEPGAGDDVRERVAAVKRWFDNDWQKLDNKIKSSIVEGVSVFLSMFDMPDVAAVFCPPPPEVSDDPRRIGPRARAAMLAEKKGPRPRARVRTAPNGPPIPLPKGRAIYRRSMN